MRIEINGEDFNNIEFKKEGRYNVLRLDDCEILFNKETTEMLFNAIEEYCTEDIMQALKNKLEER